MNKSVILSIEHLFPLIKKKTKTKQKNGIKTKTIELSIPVKTGPDITEDLMKHNGKLINVTPCLIEDCHYSTEIMGDTFYIKKSWVKDVSESNDTAELTVLSFGGGQDSTTILHMIEHDEEFRRRYASGRVLVIMSNTGNEHPKTYAHVNKIKAETNLEFVMIEPEMGYHHENWWDLETRYVSNNSIGSKAYPKTCTDNLKLQPIYKFLEDWIEREYGFKSNKKDGFKEFAKHYGKINMIIGIAAGEEGRMVEKSTDIICYKEYMEDASTARELSKAVAAEKKECKEQGVKWSGKKVKYTPASWKSAAINMSYPLVELGLDRAGCQSKIAELGFDVPVPSNCIMCPFMDDIELIWLERFLPNELDKWVQLEKNKFKANTHAGDRNLGVWGKWHKKENRPYGLLDALADAKEKHGELTDEFIEDYKMSHGHCIMSKY